MLNIRRILRLISIAGIALGGISPQVCAQGCVASHFMALSLGPDGVSQLQPGQWQAGLNLRYLYADEGWRGTHPWPEYRTIVGNEITIISTDLQATYAFSSRVSATLTLPFMYGQTSNFAEHDGTRHVVKAGGLGDIRVVGNAWLFNPESHPTGNLSVGLGLKAPTGNEAATDVYHKPAGPQVRPVDVSIQPGDGGWGVMLEVAGFRKFRGRIYGYMNGYYLISPREQNKAYTPVPIYGQVRNNSVADQYLARVGLSCALPVARGLTLSVDGRINGIPRHDLVGGSEGFRRPGYAIYVEPGLSWTGERTTFGLFVPLRVDANRQKNVYDVRNNGIGGGAFASSLVVISLARTF